MAKTPTERLTELEASETAILTGAQEGSIDGSHSFKHPALDKIQDEIEKVNEEIATDAQPQGMVSNNINFAAMEEL